MTDVPYAKAIERYPTLRQSRLANFDSCALLSHFEEEYRRDWSTYPAARGSLFHRFAARALTEMHDQHEERIEVDVALAILAEVLRQHDVDNHCHEPGCNQPAKFEDGKVVCVKGHSHRSSVVNAPMAVVKDLYWVVKKWAFDNTFDINNLVSIEERLEAIVRYPNPNGGFVERRLTGQTDAVFVDEVDDTHAIVLDWKDTWGIPPEAELSFEGYFQQRFYAWLVMKNYPSISKVSLREFYVRFSQTREAVIFRDQVDDIEQEFSALAERFDRAHHDGNFPPSPGKHCSYCPRATACPIPAFAKVEGRVTTMDQATKVTEQLVKAEAIVKQTKAALRTFAEDAGSIPVKDQKGDRVYGWQKSTKTSRPGQEDVERFLREGGKDPSELFKTTESARFVMHRPKPEDKTEEQIVADLERAAKEVNR